jgi:hypothetical protein
LQTQNRTAPIFGISNVTTSDVTLLSNVSANASIPETIHNASTIVAETVATLSSQTTSVMDETAAAVATANASMISTAPAELAATTINSASSYYNATKLLIQLARTISMAEFAEVDTSLHGFQRSAVSKNATYVCFI